MTRLAHEIVPVMSARAEEVMGPRQAVSTMAMIVPDEAQTARIAPSLTALVAHVIDSYNVRYGDRWNAEDARVRP